MKLFDNFGFGDYLLLIGITLTIHVTWFYYKYFTRINPLPGPFPFPFVGNLPQLLWSGGIPEVFFEYNRKKYGDIFEVYLEGRNIVLNRSEHFDRLLTPSTKSPYLMRSPPHSKGLDELELAGKGLLFNNNLKSWKYNRQFFSQAILSPKFTQEAIDCTNKLFNDLDNYWNKLYLQKGTKEKNKLDFSKWLNHYTNDVIITLLTGKSSCSMAAYFNMLSDEPSTMVLNDSVELVEALRKHLFGVFSFLTTTTFLRHYVPFFKNKSDDFIRNIRFINQRLDEIIKRRRKEIENTPLDEPLPHDMLTSVITANTSRDNNTKSSKNVDSITMKPMTNDEIRGIIFDGFLGGTDTTANSISFIIYYLAHNPDVKKKMLKEIDEIFQGDKTRSITENDFHNLKYCEAIVKEVGRILSVIHSFGRYSEKSDEIAGYKWPAGTWFRMNVYAVHKHEDYWEEPEKFNPDRWLVKGFEPKKHTFVMFGGGLRICPGRKLAMIELVCLMALLFRKYDIDLVDMEAPLKTETGLVVACTELLVKIKPRNQGVLGDTKC